MSPPLLTLLGRPDCHLCHELHAVAAPVAAELGLVLEQQDVRSREEWRPFLLEIPVLLLDGAEIARHRATPDELRSRLRERLGPRRE